MAGILAGYYVRQRLHAGDHVTIGHLEVAAACPIPRCSTRQFGNGSRPARKTNPGGGKPSPGFFVGRRSRLYFSNSFSRSAVTTSSRRSP
jgi:hypothetical protein